MIYIKNDTELKEKIQDWNKKNIHILTDFDRTLTTGSSSTSWSILSKSDKVPKEYIDERQKYYDYYRPIEINEEMDEEEKNRLMTEWWQKHINLFIKYQLSEEVINSAAQNNQVLSFREGAKEFLIEMYEKKIPVIIISAGIGNFIEQFLNQNDCNFDNIFIVTNFIKFTNHIASGVKDNIIHSLNKNETSLPQNIKELLKNRPNIILLGDSISDIKMAPIESRSKTLTIGFLEENVEQNLNIFKEKFDIVATNNTSFKDLKDILQK